MARKTRDVIPISHHLPVEIMELLEQFQELNKEFSSRTAAINFLLRSSLVDKLPELREKTEQLQEEERQAAIIAEERRLKDVAAFCDPIVDDFIQAIADGDFTVQKAIEELRTLAKDNNYPRAAQEADKLEEGLK